MKLDNPHSAILSAVIFNALIIVALIPLALRGVKFRPLSAAAVLRRNLLIYGLGGIIAPFIGIKLIDIVVSRPRSQLMRRQLVTGLLMTIVLTVLLGIVYPLVVTGVSQVAFSDRANGSFIEDKNGKVVGSSLIGQNFTEDRRVLPPAAVGRR